MLSYDETDETETDATWSTAWDEIVADADSALQHSASAAKDKDNSASSVVKDEKGSLNSAVVINDNKAGMEGLDKEHINQIIYEASKGSYYYKNQQKREEQLNQQMKEMDERRQRLSAQQVAYGVQKADHLIERLEADRDLSRTIVHIDMDAFYAAVEALDRPELKDKPLAVGGKYMLSTSNYAARRFGVRAAMPGFIAKKLCPDLVIVPCNFSKYTAMSERVQKIFADYDPNFCAASLDEAYMDITDHLRRRIECGEDQRFPGFDDPSRICRCVEGNKSEIGSSCQSCGKVVEEPSSRSFGLTAEEVVREMRFRIFQETCLTSSAGIAPNTMLAKVCSDRNKPNGQFYIPPTREAVMEFIQDLPIRKICGIGKVTEKMLQASGITSCSHLYDQRGVLFHLYSAITFEYFMKVCRGVGSTHVERGGQRKSMSVERTFKELSKPSDLEEICLELSQMLANDLQQECLVGRTVTLKLKTVHFEVRTRAQTLASCTNAADAIFTTARDILRTEIASVAPEPLRLRLMGIRMSSLTAISEETRLTQSTLTSMLQRLQRPKLIPTDEACQSSIPNSPDKKPVTAPSTGQHINNFFKKRSLSPSSEETVPSNTSNVNQFFSGMTSGDLDVKPTCDSDPDRVCSDVNSCPVFSDSSSEVPASGRNRGGEASSVLECPVCGVTKVWDLTVFNQHIDECLSQQAMRDILTKERKTPPQNNSRSKSVGGSLAKRRKVQAAREAATLERFFEPNRSNQKTLEDG